MKLVAGLGNPGEQYRSSRHNVGFMVIDVLGKDLGIDVTACECEALVGHGRIEGEEVILVKPSTYMNRSGLAVKALVERYELSPGSVIIVYDDMDLEPGRIRIRPKGGPGSHNGMKSVIDLLGTGEFPRVRIGIGRPGPLEDPVDYVLGMFTKDELPIIREAVHNAARAVAMIIGEGLDSAMNRFNLPMSQSTMPDPVKPDVCG